MGPGCQIFAHDGLILQEQTNISLYIFLDFWWERLVARWSRTSDIRHRENRERRERRSQILEGKMNFGRLFWANLFLADSYFFKIFFFVNLGRWRFKVGQIRGERHLLGWMRCILGDLLGRHFLPKKGTFADNLRYSLCLINCLFDFKFCLAITLILHYCCDKSQPGGSMRHPPLQYHYPHMLTKLNVLRFQEWPTL